MKINVNEKDYTVKPTGNPSLLEVLREQLDLTGTKYGCGEGACGACKVLIDGVPSAACITPVVSVQNKKVTTIEGLEKNGQLHVVQQAFLDEDVFQCGYCASGIIISAVALVEKNPKPSKEEILETMQGNICRCCTYPQISQAIRKAAKI
jgi:aerobic-type carbon monoxide dehydrogenase small subunit (CoxS/CutS family)